MKRSHVIALAAAWSAFPRPALAFGPLHPGEEAPPFTLPGNKKANVSLASFRGKPVYLNFFASWCGPCVDETPYIVKLAKRYQAKGLVTLGIDVLDEERGADFAARFGVFYPILFDKDGDVGRAYGQIGLPMHVFIDRSGKVTLWHPGEMSEPEIDEAIGKTITSH